MTATFVELQSALRDKLLGNVSCYHQLLDIPAWRVYLFEEKPFALFFNLSQLQQIDTFPAHKNHFNSTDKWPNTWHLDVCDIMQVETYTPDIEELIQETSPTN